MAGEKGAKTAEHEGVAEDPGIIQLFPKSSKTGEKLTTLSVLKLQTFKEATIKRPTTYRSFSSESTLLNAGSEQVKVPQTVSQVCPATPKYQSDPGAWIGLEMAGLGMLTHSDGADDGVNDTDGLSLGMDDGANDTEGLSLGTDEGAKDSEGTSLGTDEGAKDSDGTPLGTVEGAKDSEGTSLGLDDGAREGTSLGLDDGDREGTSLGLDDGDREGTSLGLDDGDREGTSLGTDDGLAVVKAILTTSAVVQPLAAINPTPNTKPGQSQMLMEKTELVNCSILPTATAVLGWLKASPGGQVSFGRGLNASPRKSNISASSPTSESSFLLPFPTLPLPEDLLLPLPEEEVGATDKDGADEGDSAALLATSILKATSILQTPEGMSLQPTTVPPTVATHSSIVAYCR